MTGARFRPGLWPSLLTALGLVVLCGLGGWQVQRLAWKTDLLATIDARLGLSPANLPVRIEQPETWRYRPVRLNGSFDHAREVYLFSGRRGGGWLIYTPLIRPAGAPVLINRGWVPDDKRAPAQRPQSQLDGPVRIEGIARLSRPGGFLTPAPDAAGRLFYAPDIERMAAVMDLPAVAPLIIDQAPAADPDALPRGGQTRVDIPNDHLQYAGTWFALALVLLAIYAGFGFKRGRAA